jgi:hypothetical protein
MHVKFIEIPPYCSGNLQTSFSSLRLGKSTLSEILNPLSELLTPLSEILTLLSEILTLLSELLTPLSELLTLLSEILTPLSERSRGERITPRLRSGCMCPNRGACGIRGVHISGIMHYRDSLPLYSSFIQIPTQ